MSVFVSYTRTDESLVRTLVDDLERLGRSVWMDHDIHGGESWWREIIREIQRAELFIFALSDSSWRSQPCRSELEYAEKLGIPVLPVRVGPVESMRIPLAEKQIIDYRGRSADAAIGLAGALRELTSRPPTPPDPLPEPPPVPFAYLYRIASWIGPNRISPDQQEELIGKLRRNLKDEADEVARADILKLLREIRDRRELTVQNAAEIDEILSGIEAAKVPEPEDGATRLPPADHWRRGMPSVPSPVQETGEAQCEATAEPAGPGTREQPAENAESSVGTPATPPWPAPVAEPKTAPESPPVQPAAASIEESGTPPAWLSDLIRHGGGRGKATASQVGATPAAPAAPATPAAAATTQWWRDQETAPAGNPTRSPVPVRPSAPATPGKHRFASSLALVIVGLAIVIILVLIVSAF